jgi:hypothetical protein
MDVHIPLAITEGLRRRRIDVLTAQQDGADRLNDDLLLQRATRLERVYSDNYFSRLATIRSPGF